MRTRKVPEWSRTAIESTAQADGTRYRLVVTYEPQGGWIVVWPEGGWTAIVFSFNPTRRGVHFDRAWGRASKADVKNLSGAAWDAIRLLLDTDAGGPQ